jgi:hypothetical protein
MILRRIVFLKKGRSDFDIREDTITCETLAERNFLGTKVMPTMEVNRRKIFF